MSLCVQRMLGEISLEPEQLESVFDSLDVDGNGFLTLEEFANGFGKQYFPDYRAKVLLSLGPLFF